MGKAIRAFPFDAFGADPRACTKTGSISPMPSLAGSYGLPTSESRRSRHHEGFQASKQASHQVRRQQATHDASPGCLPLAACQQQTRMKVPRCRPLSAPACGRSKLQQEHIAQSSPSLPLTSARREKRGKRPMSATSRRDNRAYSKDFVDVSSLSLPLPVPAHSDHLRGPSKGNRDTVLVDARYLLSSPPPRPRLEEVVGMDVADIRNLFPKKSASEVLSEKLLKGVEARSTLNIGSCTVPPTTISHARELQSRHGCPAKRQCTPAQVSASCVGPVSGHAVPSRDGGCDRKSRLRTWHDWAQRLRAIDKDKPRSLPALDTATSDLLEWTQDLLHKARPESRTASRRAVIGLPPDFCELADANASPAGGSGSCGHADRAPSSSFSNPDGKRKSSATLSFLAKRKNKARSSTMPAGDLSNVSLPSVSVARKSLKMIRGCRASLASFVEAGASKNKSHELVEAESGSEVWSGEDVSPTAEIGEEEAKQRLAAFRRLCVPGEDELGSVRLGWALELLGHWRPDRDLVDEATYQQRIGDQRVSLEKFLKFVECYEAKFQESMMVRFEEADKDDSGEIDSAELSAWLRGQGIVPVPGLGEALIEDVVGAGSDSSEIDFAGFLEIHDIMRRRSGFSKSEADQFLAVFSRYDCDGNGKISHDEVMGAISWLGLPADRATVTGLLSQVDPDSSNAITKREFLVAMQKLRQIEIGKMMMNFEDMDRDNSGTLDAGELAPFFEATGVMRASPELLSEVTAACGLADRSELLFEEVYTIMQEVRNTEGYLSAELEELTTIFNALDAEADGSGDVGPVDVARIIEYMGYQTSLEKVQDAFVQFDFDKSGKLDFQEVIKMLSQHRDAEMSSVRAAFRAREAHIDMRVPRSDLAGVLALHGHREAAEPMHEFEQRVCKGIEDETLGFWEFARHVWQHRNDRATKTQSKMFFTDADIAYFRRQFRKHEAKRHEGVPVDLLHTLLREVRPGSASTCKGSKAEQERRGEGGNVDFQEFLWLARLDHDQFFRERIEKLRAAEQSTKFTKEETREFRRIFRTFDSTRSGEMLWPDFAEFASSMIDFDSPLLQDELEQCLRFIDEQETSGLDFADALILMRKLLDQDWSGIASMLEEERFADVAAHA